MLFDAPETILLVVPSDNSVQGIAQRQDGGQVTVPTVTMFFRIMRSRLAGRAAGFQNCRSRAITTWCTGVRGRAQVAWQVQDIPSKRAKAALPMLIRGYATKETSRTQIEQEMAQIQRRIRRSYLHCEYDDALGYAEMLNKMSNEYFESNTRFMPLLSIIWVY